MKPNHRSNYFRKKRRWAKVREIVENTQTGKFDGLIVATYMDPTGVLKHLVPLLRGGAQVVVYSPHIEPIMEVCDAYSTARRTAYLQELQKREKLPDEVKIEKKEDKDDIEEDANGDEVIKIENNGTSQVHTPEKQQQPSYARLDDPRFPVDPTLLLVPTVHHSHARPWQVLPGRTHPLMMGKGGAEGGYVLVSTKVIPVEGVLVQARGKQGRTKKRAAADQGQENLAGDSRGVELDGDGDGVEEEIRAAKRGRIEE